MDYGQEIIQRVITWSIIFGFFIIVYAKMRNKTLREIWDDVKTFLVGE